MKYKYTTVKKIINTCFLLLLFFLNRSLSIGQSGVLKGQITDSKTGETLIGATVMIQETTKGTVTDIDGNYILKDLNNSNYNVVVSYVSYRQIVQRVNINGTTQLDFKLEPSSVEMDAVKVTASKRTDTEMALISNLKSASVVANGISRQQISRSQDKDASEVASRVPGVTIRDGRFINVRGLDERYNIVSLNGLAAPSSESDRKAFSFDMLPASLIDNLVLYKTSLPEIPADFAGAMVMIQTKNTIEKNGLEISYHAGYRYNTTFREFYTYKGGSTDWLGFDNGARALPDGFPSTPREFRELADAPDNNDKDRITALGRSFSKVWSPRKRSSFPDQSFGLTINRKFRFDKITAGNVTSLGYSTGDQFREVFRAGYQSYNVTLDRPDTAYYFNDDIYSTKTKLNGLFNWVFTFGKNQKIEFRNFFNQSSDKQTISRLGRDNYGGLDKAGYELSFQTRSIYSGQLGGTFNFRDSRSLLNFNAGYSYTNKLQPDIRRVELNKDESTDNYTLSFNFNADPKMIGRLYLTNHENIYMGTVNYSHKFTPGNISPELKTGFLIEEKEREFTARNIGFAAANILNFNWSLSYMPIDSVFQDKNINDTNGLKIDESTNPTDSYNAGNSLYAGYIGLDVPVGNLRIYGGFRVEKNIQTLSGLDVNGAPYNVNNNLTDFFPSLNLSFNIREKSVIRFAYGKTINRPEFREISLQSYYDFEEKATIYGNPALRNAYVQNIDLRYEWFPSNGDIITLGGFYKQFKNPIEAHLKEAGSGRNYSFDNAREAASYGVEIDLRKSFTKLSESSAAFSYMKHIVVVFNASFIKSELHSDETNARESVRSMQGQSPYIINTGLFYDNADKGLMISVLYNVIGPRLMFVGDVDEPHIIQMPRHLIDITVNKKLGKHMTFKLGVKDLFNQPVELRQNERIQLIPGISDSSAKRVQRTQIYKPSSALTAGLTLSL